jgi:hypothetical protein
MKWSLVPFSAKVKSEFNWKILETEKLNSHGVLFSFPLHCRVIRTDSPQSLYSQSLFAVKVGESPAGVRREKIEREQSSPRFVSIDDKNPPFDEIPRC